MIAEELNMDKETKIVTNLNMKKSVPKLSQRIHQFSTRKQIPMLEQTLYYDFVPCDFCSQN
jgi:hypothetical protein